MEKKEMNEHGQVLCGECNKHYLCVTCGAQCGSEGHWVDPPKNYSFSLGLPEDVAAFLTKTSSVSAKEIMESGITARVTLQRNDDLIIPLFDIGQVQQLIEHFASKKDSEIAKINSGIISAAEKGWHAGFETGQKFSSGEAVSIQSLKDHLKQYES